MVHIKNSSAFDRAPGAGSKFWLPSYRGVKIQLFTFTLHLLGSGLMVMGGHPGVTCDIKLRL